MESGVEKNWAIRNLINNNTLYYNHTHLDNANLTENANKIVIKNIDKKFLLQYLMNDFFQNIILSSITNNAQPKLSLKRIRSFLILIPSPAEQQKIADCLSSIDELIAAQSQKLDALKAHKKGLMQQLFPAGDSDHE